MKNLFHEYDLSPFALAVNWKVASSSLATAMLQRYAPVTWLMLNSPPGDGTGTAYPEGKNAFNSRFQTVAYTTESPTKPAILVVRDPVEKFRSACVESGITDVDAKLDSLEGGDLRGHFALQSRFTSTGVELRLYRMEEHLDAVAAALDLNLPLPTVPTVENAPRPVLTPTQVSRVLAIYAADASMHQSITSPGVVVAPPQVVTAPAVPEAIANWRCKVVLSLRGLLPTVEETIAALPEPQKTVVQTAWVGGADVARHGATVTAMASLLNLSDADIDEMFRQAQALEV